MQTETEPRSEYGFEWGPWTRRVAIVVLLIAAAIAVFSYQYALKYTVFAAILAYVLYFPIRFLARRTRLSYGQSILVVFLVHLALLLLVLILAAPVLVEGFLDLTKDVGDGIKESGTALLNYQPGQSRLDVLARPLSRLVKAQLSPKEVEASAENVEETLTAAVQGVSALAGSVTTLMTIHFFALFALIEIPKLYLGAVERLSSERQRELRREFLILTHRMMNKWRRVFWSSLFYGALLGVLNAVQMSILGIPAAPVVGLLTGIVALIPFVGPIANIFIIAGTALVQGSTLWPISPLMLALLTVGLNLVIIAILAEVVFPKIVGNAVSQPVIVIIPVVMIAGALGGGLGMIVAVPLLGFAAEIIEYTLKKIRGGDPYPGEPEPVPFAGMFPSKGEA